MLYVSPPIGIRFSIRLTTMSGTVDGLVKLGPVNRITGPDNRRYVRLGLTSKGRRKVDFIDCSCDQFCLQLLDRIPGERWRPWRAVAARILWHLYLSNPARNRARQEPVGSKVEGPLLATARKPQRRRQRGEG